MDLQFFLLLPLFIRPFMKLQGTSNPYLAAFGQKLTRYFSQSSIRNTGNPMGLLLQIITLPIKFVDGNVKSRPHTVPILADVWIITKSSYAAE